MNPVTGTGRTSVDIGVYANLELVDKFCYLSDILSVDRDVDAAVENRIRVRWNKFRQMVPLFTNKDISLKVRGRWYSSCVQSSMLHGSEIWPIRKENEVAFQWAEMRMVKSMCGMKLQDRIPSKGLRQRLGLDVIILVLQRNSLWWYGHMLWKEDNDWVKKCMEYEVEGARSRVDREKLGERLWKKIVRHVDWTGRMPWIVLDRWSRKGQLMTTIGVSGLMFLLVPAHPGCPGQNPESHKMVVLLLLVVAVQVSC